MKFPNGGMFTRIKGVYLSHRTQHSFLSEIQNEVLLNGDKYLVPISYLEIFSQKINLREEACHLANKPK